LGGSEWGAILAGEGEHVQSFQIMAPEISGVMGKKDGATKNPAWEYDCRGIMIAVVNNSHPDKER
jgi:hypothetical protein